MAKITTTISNEKRYPAVKDEDGEKVKRFRVDGIVYATSLKAAKSIIKDDYYLDAAQVTS